MSVWIDGVEYHFRRLASGLTSALFEDKVRADNQAEWIDRNYRQTSEGLVALGWRGEQLALEVKSRTEDAMVLASIGLRPLLHPDIPEGVLLYRSEESGDDPTIVVERDGEFVAILNGWTFDDIRDELPPEEPKPGPMI